MIEHKTFAGLAMAVALFAAAGTATAAEPTLHEVYQAAESGNLKQAEAMMDQVLRDHPNSAKAHYVEAELLTKEGRIDMAKAELAHGNDPWAKQMAQNVIDAQTKEIADMLDWLSKQAK